MRRLVLIIAALALCGFVDPTPDKLADRKEEARAEALFQQIRCVVCQNESIAASEAPLAHQMRMLIRGQVSEGKTNSQIKAYLFERYGDFILLKPRLTAMTALLWLGPFAVVLIGVTLILLRRRRPAPLEDELTAAELKALKKLAKEEAKATAE